MCSGKALLGAGKRAAYGAILSKAGAGWRDPQIPPSVGWDGKPVRPGAMS